MRGCGGGGGAIMVYELTCSGKNVLGQKKMLAISSQIFRVHLYCYIFLTKTWCPNVSSI